MANMNKKFPGQGKTPQQYQDSTRFAWYGVLGMVMILILVMLLSGCAVTYPLDPCCDKEHTTEVYYHNNLIYFGYNSGYYYYYGKPHYYPWHYYYNTRPPFYYNVTTHIMVNNIVNKPTHRPNKPTIKITHRPNINRNKVIIKSNNGPKKTNKTTIKRRKK